MGTFADLNAYSEELIEFTDNRPANVLFTIPGEPDDLEFTLLSYTFTLQRSIDIIEIIQPQTTDVVFSVNVSGVPGTTVTWPTIPAGSTVTNLGGVYSIDGIDTVSIWETVRAPTISVPTSFNGSFFYICTISYTTDQGRQSVSWQVGTFIPVALFQTVSTQTTQPSRVRFLTNQTLTAGFTIPTADIEISGFNAPEETDWYAEQSNNITGAPNIVYLDTADTWYITITPSNTSIVSTIGLTASVSGLTSSFNNVTKVFTMNGTKAQVNQALNSLTFTATATRADFTFGYSSYRSSEPGIVYTRTQSARCMNLQRLTDARGTATYVTASSSLIGTSSPTILDPDYTGVGTYTFTIAPTQTSLVNTLSSTGITRWGVEQEYTYTASNTGELSQLAYGSGNNVLVLGNPGDDTLATNAGAFHFFVKTGIEYSLVQNVFISNAWSSAGGRLAMADDDTLIVSGYGYTNSSDPVGRAWVYLRGSGNNWNLAQTLTPPDGAIDSWFGYQLTCSRNGDVLAISEPTDVQTGETRTGRVHIYTRTGTGNYTRQTTILDPDNDLNSSFGWGQCVLSPNGTRLAITDSLGDNDTYIFSGSGSTWTLDEKLANTFRVINFTVDGSKYLWSDGTNIYVNTRQSNGTWTQTASFTPSITPGAMRVSVDRTRILIKQLNTTTNFNYLLIDFDAANNTFTENRSINLSSYLSSSSNFGLNLDGTEINAVGRLANGNRGFVTYTFGPKPGAFNNSTKTLTIEGTKAEVQADIDTIRLVTNAGVVSTITFNSSVVTPEAFTQTKQFTAVNS